MSSNVFAPVAGFEVKLFLGKPSEELDVDQVINDLLVGVARFFATIYAIYPHASVDLLGMGLGMKPGGFDCSCHSIPSDTINETLERLGVTRDEFAKRLRQGISESMDIDDAIKSWGRD